MAPSIPPSRLTLCARHAPRIVGVPMLDALFLAAVSLAVLFTGASTLGAAHRETPIHHQLHQSTGDPATTVIAQATRHSIRERIDRQQRLDAERRRRVDAARRLRLQDLRRRRQGEAARWRAESRDARLRQRSLDRREKLLRSRRNAGERELERRERRRLERRLSRAAARARRLREQKNKICRGDDVWTCCKRRFAASADETDFTVVIGGERVRCPFLPALPAQRP